MLVVAALLAVARAFRSTGRRGVWAVLAAAFAAFAMVRSTLPLTGYEVESASAQRMVEAFQTSVLGKPLLAELLIAAAAGLWLARSHLRGGRVRFERLADGGAMVAVGTAGAILVVWAARPEQWAMALDFHFWQAPIGLCLALGATADALTSARRDRLVSPAVLTCGLVFCAVLLVQVWTWAMTSSQLRTELLGEGAPCTTIQRVAAAPGRSVLDHWSTAAYALVLQSRAPTRFVLADEAACQRLITSGSLWFAAWDVRPPKSGWFALRP
jgi:hypothetical protein